MKTLIKNTLAAVGLLVVAVGIGLAVTWSSADIALGEPGTVKSVSGPLTVTGALSQTKMYTGGNGRVGLALTLEAADFHGSDLEQSVDLVVVLDQSGSMTGQKINDAKRAVIEVLNELGRDDRFALVTYSRDVWVRAELSPVTGEFRSRVSRVVRSLQADANTNLGGGLQAGMNILARSGNRSSQGKVVLISDGRANEGIVDPRQLGRMASGAHEYGFTVTTVGVGLDYNELVLSRIADQGGGNYYFMEHPDMFADIFQQEVRMSRAVCARGVEIRVPVTNGMKLIDAAGYPVERDGDMAVFRPGPVRAGQDRTLILTMGVPVDRGGVFTVRDIEVSFEDPDGKRNLKLEESLSVACVQDEEEAWASVNQSVWEQQVVQEEYNLLKEQVAEDMRKGDEGAAMDKIARYEAEKGEQNALVGSSAVEKNLSTDVQELKSNVEQAFSPAAEPMATQRAAKQMQSESYDDRRHKQKQ